MAVSHSLWSDELLERLLVEQPEYQELTNNPAPLREFQEAVTPLLAKYAQQGQPNEAVTREEVILPLLRVLGWSETTTEQSITPADTPDRMLFADETAHALADRSEAPVLQAIGLVESKPWRRGLDARGSGSRPGETAAEQIQRYLLSAHVDSERQVRWAILTNGAQWRLYSAEARPRTRHWHVDLTELLALNVQASMFADPENGETEHGIRTAYLLLRRDSWVPGDGARQSFLDRLLAEGARTEVALAQNLSKVIFDHIYRDLVRTFWTQQPTAQPGEIGQAALTFLYRLLFVFYAEDRAMLPTEEPGYKPNSLRHSLRDPIAEQFAAGDFSTTFTNFWNRVAQLMRALDQGDLSVGIHPYNGGLFAAYRHSLLDRVALSDAELAPIIQALSHYENRYISYRDLSIQQLGSIYERLLEYVPTRDANGQIDVILQPYARKDTGSYYTPQELVDIVVERTLEPLIDDRIETFLADPAPERDPAAAVLDLKVIDPAIGSGHFLLKAIDYLTDRTIDLLRNEWDIAPIGYVSPLQERIDRVRSQIEDPPGDREIVQRMVLKRCVYGVDKNPSAVALAKVAIWLHTFTPSLPLPYLDHRILEGDSLLGVWTHTVREFLNTWGRDEPTTWIGAESSDFAAAASEMDDSLDLTREQITASEEIRIRRLTNPHSLKHSHDLIFGLRWGAGGLKSKKAKRAHFEPVHDAFNGHYGRALNILTQGANEPGLTPPTPEFQELRRQALATATREHPLHWQLAFPEIWRGWDQDVLDGGFDAVIGNPPWDRIKLEQVEWWAARDPWVAMSASADTRRKRIAERRKESSPLVAQFEDAQQLAVQYSDLIRRSGDYLLLSKGDINIYRLFVERAQQLVKPDGMIGLLTPSGIYGDLYASAFFQSLSTTGRISGIYDFENRRSKNPHAETARWFDDVDSRFKFCAMISGGAERQFDEAHCGFFLHGKGDLDDPERLFPLTPLNFKLVNPNTGTSPILQHRRDAEIVLGIYEQHPVLNDHNDLESSFFPQSQLSMFHMTNNSDLFRTREQLNEMKAYQVVEGDIDNRYMVGQDRWLPLYQGRMIHQFDHRANEIGLNAENVNNPYVSIEVTNTQKEDSRFYPRTQYWVSENEVLKKTGHRFDWAVAFRDIARGTDERTMIASVVQWSGYSNKVPLLLPRASFSALDAARLVSNFNSLALDYVAKCKVHGTNMNWYIVEQLPMIAPPEYNRTFGDKQALDLVREHVLELSYTAWDLQAFARELGHYGDPFEWNASRRRQLRARLDALYFHLYGLKEGDVDYILNQFSVLEDNERKEHSAFVTKQLVLGQYRALEQGVTGASVGWSVDVE